MTLSFFDSNRVLHYPLAAFLFGHDIGIYDIALIRWVSKANKACAKGKKENENVPSKKASLFCSFKN